MTNEDIRLARDMDIIDQRHIDMERRLGASRAGVKKTRARVIEESFGRDESGGMRWGRDRMMGIAEGLGVGPTATRFMGETVPEMGLGYQMVKLLEKITTFFIELSNNNPVRPESIFNGSSFC